MNDEIKEILSDLKNTGYEKLAKNIENIIGYITNLQEKIKHYEETTTFGDYVKEVNLLVDYKSRIEKAVEYLKERERNTEEYIKTINMSRNCYIIEQEEVIDILNGRSDK